jgi:hypothetical protein
VKKQPIQEPAAPTVQAVNAAAVKVGDTVLLTSVCVSNGTLFPNSVLLLTWARKDNKGNRVLFRTQFMSV